MFTDSCIEFGFPTGISDDNGLGKDPIKVFCCDFGDPNFPLLLSETLWLDGK